MMLIREVCPRCKSSRYKKNGHIHNNKQNHHCISRLVRDVLSFSKKLAHHIDAIKLCMCHYNLTKAAAENEHYHGYHYHGLLCVTVDGLSHLHCLRQRTTFPHCGSWTRPSSSSGKCGFQATSQG